MGHMVLPLTDFNCQNLRKFIYKLSEHATTGKHWIPIGIRNCVRIMMILTQIHFPSFNPSFPATSGFLQNPHITLMKSSKQQSRRAACDPWRNRCAVENNFDGTIQNPNLILILRRGNSKALSKLSGGWFVYQCLKPAAHGSVMQVTDFDVVIWSQKSNHNIWIIWFDLTFSPWAVWVYLIWNVSHWPSTTVNNYQQLPTWQSSKVQLC